jgi:hypothetical protein
MSSFPLSLCTHHVFYRQCGRGRNGSPEPDKGTSAGSCSLRLPTARLGSRRPSIMDPNSNDQELGMGRLHDGRCAGGLEKFRVL